MDTTKARQRRVLRPAARGVLVAAGALTAGASLAVAALLVILAARVAPLEREAPRQARVHAWRQRDLRLGAWSLGVRPRPDPRTLRPVGPRGEPAPPDFVMVWSGSDGGGTPSIERPLPGGRLAWSRRLAPGEKVVVTQRRGRKGERRPGGLKGMHGTGDEVIFEFMGDPPLRVVPREQRTPDAVEVFPGLEIDAQDGGRLRYLDMRDHIAGNWAALEAREARRRAHARRRAQGMIK